LKFWIEKTKQQNQNNLFYFVNDIEKISTDKHENIFFNNGFKLFEYILEHYISNKRGKYEDLSFFYRKLYDDKFIHQRPTPFKEWYNEEYNENIDKIKTIQQTENENRIKHYQLSIDWFKQKK
jgi:hypothetical protein